LVVLSPARATAGGPHDRSPPAGRAGPPARAPGRARAHRPRGGAGLPPHLLARAARGRAPVAGPHAQRLLTSGVLARAQPIADRDDPRIAPYRDLRDRDLRALRGEGVRGGAFVVEGEVPLRVLLGQP